MLTHQHKYKVGIFVVAAAINKLYLGQKINCVHAIFFFFLVVLVDLNNFKKGSD